MALSNDSTSTAAIIEKIVSSIVQDTLITNSVMIPLVWNYSNQVRDGMDRVDIPRFDQPPVQTVDDTADADITPFVATIETDLLNLDINSAISWSITDRANVQDKVNTVAQITKDAARSMAASVDDSIITQLLVTTNPIQYANTPSDTLQQEDILEARKVLNNLNVPLSERFIVINADQEKALLLLPDFVRADQYGRIPSALSTGELGTLYGMPVFLSTSALLSDVETSTLIFWRQSCAYATQITSRFDTDRNIQRLQDEFTLSMLYGVQILDSGNRNTVINSTGT